MRSAAARADLRKERSLFSCTCATKVRCCSSIPFVPFPRSSSSLDLGIFQSGVCPARSSELFYERVGLHGLSCCTRSEILPMTSFTRVIADGLCLAGFYHTWSNLSQGFSRVYFSPWSFRWDFQSHGSKVGCFLFESDGQASRIALFDVVFLSHFQYLRSWISTILSRRVSSTLAYQARFNKA